MPAQWALGDSYAFWLAGRARGVDQVGQVAVFDGRWRQRRLGDLLISNRLDDVYTFQ
ncbi:hypothetical protein D3C81_2114860 [compost metagenome]